MDSIHEERRVVCQSSPRVLWPVISDTERMNRAVGFGKIELSDLSNGTAARYSVNAHLGPFPIQYEERPFEWVYPTRFAVLRRMNTGPLAELEVEHLVTERKDGGSDVQIKMRFLPRSPLFRPLLTLAGGRTITRFAEETLRVDKALSENQPLPIGKIKRTNSRTLTRAIEALRRSEPAGICDQLRLLVVKGADVDVGRIRPFALADEWNEDRIEVLNACLRAVHAGLFELRWEIVCPSCRTATDVLPSLDQLTQHGSCQLCDLGFDLDLDASVEVTFAPAASIRVVDDGPYCIGGPARTPHVVSQAILPAQGEATLSVPPEEGAYRLFVRGGIMHPVQVAAGFPSALKVTDDVSVETMLSVAPAGQVTVINTEDDERHTKLERSDYVNQAATARLVTSLPTFRRDFSSDVLRPGMALKVARAGLLFSDLTGSTALYARVGDAAAFALVQDHFEIIFELIERHGGVVIKTIGDAVMGAFQDDADGLRASVDILRRFGTLQAESERFRDVDIKLGFFAGPCYAVTANGVLDYFGQTVNIAARLQGLADGGQLVVTTELADEAIRDGYVCPEQILSREQAQLKGVDGAVSAARIIR